MPNHPLAAGERTICRQVKIPESLDRRLRARAVSDGDRKLGEVIRAALRAYLDDERNDDRNGDRNGGPNDDRGGAA